MDVILDNMGKVNNINRNNILNKQIGNNNYGVY